MMQMHGLYGHLAASPLLLTQRLKKESSCKTLHYFSSVFLLFHLFFTGHVQTRPALINAFCRDHFLPSGPCERFPGSSGCTDKLLDQHQEFRHYRFSNRNQSQDYYFPFGGGRVGRRRLNLCFPKTDPSLCRQFATDEERQSRDKRPVSLVMMAPGSLFSLCPAHLAPKQRSLALRTSFQKPPRMFSFR